MQQTCTKKLSLFTFKFILCLYWNTRKNCLPFFWGVICSKKESLDISKFRTQYIYPLLIRVCTIRMNVIVEMAKGRWSSKCTRGTILFASVWEGFCKLRSLNDKTGILGRIDRHTCTCIIILSHWSLTRRFITLRVLAFVRATRAEAWHRNTFVMTLKGLVTSFHSMRWYWKFYIYNKCFEDFVVWGQCNILISTILLDPNVHHRMV